MVLQVCHRLSSQFEHLIKFAALYFDYCTYKYPWILFTYLHNTWINKIMLRRCAPNQWVGWAGCIYLWWLWAQTKWSTDQVLNLHALLVLNSVLQPFCQGSFLAPHSLPNDTLTSEWYTDWLVPFHWPIYWPRSNWPIHHQPLSYCLYRLLYVPFLYPDIPLLATLIQLLFTSRSLVLDLDFSYISLVFWTLVLIRYIVTDTVGTPQLDLWGLPLCQICSQLLFPCICYRTEDYHCVSVSHLFGSPLS